MKLSRRRHGPAAGATGLPAGPAPLNHGRCHSRKRSMSPTVVKPRTRTRTRTQRPKLWKVILLNDDFTPREFVVQVLKAVFRMNESEAYRVMMTAHQKGACVIAVYTRDVADTKAKEATELGKANGYPLYFTTEPEE
jgi:ATP-dependent Clp protease adaptor protein ClpS